jgi:hypothetical protein
MVLYDRLDASANEVYPGSRRIEREIATWGLRGGNWPRLMRVFWLSGRGGAANKIIGVSVRRSSSWN